LTAARTTAPPVVPGAIRTTWPVLFVLGATAAALRLLESSGAAWLPNLLLVFVSLLVEAMPFVLVGALVSAAIEVLVPASAFAKIAALPRLLQLPAAAAAGVAFPVCECGSVPVARRLARKGLTPGAAVTFMLAAPIVNPVVVASTFVAYRGREALGVMVVGRLALGFLVAIAAGWVIGAMSGEALLREGRGGREPEEERSRVSQLFAHLAGDVVFMGRFLVVGAAIAAAIQTFVPQTFVDSVASTPVLGLAAMMALAFVMSLCSESDAFVAASFTAFGPSAQLAFLVFGPMVDLKLGALYLGTFRRGAVGALVITVLAVTLATTMWLQVVVG
jgi:uncharacterized protein